MKVKDTFILLNILPCKWVVKMSTVQAINCGEQFLGRVKGWRAGSFGAGSVCGAVTSCSIPCAPQVAGALCPRHTSGSHLAHTWHCSVHLQSQCQSWQCPDLSFPTADSFYSSVCNAGEQCSDCPELLNWSMCRLGSGRELLLCQPEQTAPALTWGALALSTFDKQLIPLTMKPSSVLVASLCFAHSQSREILTRLHLKPPHGLPGKQNENPSSPPGERLDLTQGQFLCTVFCLHLVLTGIYVCVQQSLYTNFLMLYKSQGFSLSSAFSPRNNHNKKQETKDVIEAIF